QPDPALPPAGRSPASRSSSTRPQEPTPPPHGASLRMSAGGRGGRPRERYGRGPDLDSATTDPAPSSVYSGRRSRPGGRGPSKEGRGKSGLHRAGCWVTPRRGDPRTVPQETHRPPPRGDPGQGQGWNGEVGAD